MLKIMNLHYETINHVNKWDCYKLGVVNSIFYLQLSNKIRSSFLTIFFFFMLHAQIFEPFGPVELVQLPLDLETGQCKGFGFVQVSDYFPFSV